MAVAGEPEIVAHVALGIGPSGLIEVLMALTRLDPKQLLEPVAPIESRETTEPS